MFLLKTKLLGKECQDFVPFFLLSFCVSSFLCFLSFFFFSFVFNQKFISISFSFRENTNFNFHSGRFFSSSQKTRFQLFRSIRNFFGRSDEKKPESVEIREQFSAKPLDPSKQLRKFATLVSFSDGKEWTTSTRWKTTINLNKVVVDDVDVGVDVVAAVDVSQAQLWLRLVVASTRATTTISAAHFNTTYAVTRKKANFGADSRRRRRRRKQPSLQMTEAAAAAAAIRAALGRKTLLFIPSVSFFHLGLFALPHSSPSPQSFPLSKKTSGGGFARARARLPFLLRRNRGREEGSPVEG